MAVEKLYRDWPAGAHSEWCVSHDASWERLRGDGGSKRFSIWVAEVLDHARNLGKGEVQSHDQGSKSFTFAWKEALLSLPSLPRSILSALFAVHCLFM